MFRSTRRHRQDAPAAAVVEGLESRKLMSATLGAPIAYMSAGGLLNITGTTAKDSITVSVKDDVMTVKHRIPNDSGGTSVKPILKVKASAVKEIKAVLFAGDDYIGLDSDVLAKSKIWCGPGDDIAGGGGGNDLIYGGWGDDSINGDSGNDWLYGQAGWDNVYGGKGNDLVNGGDGTDYLYGNDGDDTIESKDGAADWINGAAGTDKVKADVFSGMWEKLKAEDHEIESLIE